VLQYFYVRSVGELEVNLGQVKSYILTKGRCIEDLSILTGAPCYSISMSGQLVNWK